jgi:thiamine-monophosphate kinase
MGEFELLARIRERLPPTGPRVRVGMGDDAAVTMPGGATATSVDAVVEGVHFRREHSGPGQIGHKALATALSDLAAMGAEAGEAYIVLGVPPGMSEDECIELVDGVIALAERTGTALAGGDVTRAPALTVATTVVGHAATPGDLVTRAGARPGDALVLTGEVGGAAAGLSLLERPEPASAVSTETAERLRSRQLEPHPLLAAGRALAQAGATAMVDLSDGLGADAAHIAEESAVSLRIDASAVPLASGVAEVAEVAGLDPLSMAVSGGEDYELLAAVPPERLLDAVAAVGETRATLTVIGEVVEGEGVEIRLPGGRALEPSGFDQLR